MKQKMVANIRYIKSNYLLYLLVAPAVILTIIFKYVPIYGLLIAFKDYNPLNGIMGSEWVGLEHFTRFMSSPNFSILLINTLKLSVYGLLLGFFPPIILALSFNLLASDKLKKRLQLILYAPNFISVVVIAGMLFLFFANKGPINNIFESLTGKTLPFLTGPKYFRPLYIFSGIWQGIGWSSILYTATLANVPPELIEASEIDGANILQRIWHIDLPALKPVMTISFILAAGGIMSIGYEKAYLLQTTMNLPSSEIIATYVYKVGLQSGDYSYSTAVGLFNSVINLILLVSVNQVVKKLNDGEGL
ncbi:putative multiple-sugar transport system permease YteP [Lactococcus lactis]|uniref:ABC transporter permease n=1 Tax=Lactococcus lactis TaxID=1358 RepID=UPI00071E0B9D|nr:ABC transporter permease subunit [Lactococcus lactis]KST80302.1 ABC-type polysaccharide transport system permease component [Lactococcus lactis subsp. lactis]MDU0412230.1 putative multiple-sugar transport system permease YteP [Lactococcus lactis]